MSSSQVKVIQSAVPREVHPKSARGEAVGVTAMANAMEVRFG
jgi:hypothetical protein